MNTEVSSRSNETWLWNRPPLTVLFRGAQEHWYNNIVSTYHWLRLVFEEQYCARSLTAAVSDLELQARDYAAVIIIIIIIIIIISSVGIGTHMDGTT
jgi:hypothetical protein